MRYDDPILAAESERAEAITPGPCPDWCGEESGDQFYTSAWDTQVGGQLNRTHSSVVLNGDVGIEIQQVEHLKDGRTSLGEIFIYADLAAYNASRIEPAEALVLADALTSAIGKLDRIKAAHR